jgi:hypothetical protein
MPTRSATTDSWLSAGERVIRQLGGDDTGQGEILSLRPNTVLRVTVYRYE